MSTASCHFCFCLWHKWKLQVIAIKQPQTSSIAAFFGSFLILFYPVSKTSFVIVTKTITNQAQRGVNNSLQSQSWPIHPPQLPLLADFVALQQRHRQAAKKVCHLQKHFSFWGHLLKHTVVSWGQSWHTVNCTNTIGACQESQETTMLSILWWGQAKGQIAMNFTDHTHTPLRDVRFPLSISFSSRGFIRSECQHNIS